MPITLKDRPRVGWNSVKVEGEATLLAVLGDLTFSFRVPSKNIHVVQEMDGWRILFLYGTEGP